MGYYKDKYASLDAALLDEELREKEEELKLQELRILQEQEFRKEMNNDLISCINNFSNSILTLAKSMSEQKPPIVINVDINNKEDASNLKEILEYLK